MTHYTTTPITDHTLRMLTIAAKAQAAAILLQRVEDHTARVTVPSLQNGVHRYI